MSELRAIIFDFNGVVIDDEPIHLMMFRRVLAEEGLGVTDQEYHDKYLGYDDRGFFLEVLKANGREISTEFCNDLIARKSVYYNAHVAEHMPIFPGVPEFVRRVAAQWPLAVCSGALRGEIDFVLGKLGLAECFRLVVSAEDTTAWKPDPQGYLITLDRLAESLGNPLAAEDVLVIEDSLAGLEAARRAGTRTLAVTNSYSAEELVGQADLVTAGLDSVSDSQLQAVFNT
jgi:HAD superfamily hydrolase (TIGR01509 family)